MSTIEDKHFKKLRSVKNTEDEIDYLLDVAPLLDSYGDITALESGDKKINGSLGNNFVHITSTSSNGSLYKKYMSITENEETQDLQSINSYVCEICNVSKYSLQNDSMMICPVCGCTDVYFDSGAQGMSYDQEINSEMNSSFAYKRINHFNEWLAQFQAKESTNIPDDLVDKLKIEFKKARITKLCDITQGKVRGLLKKLGYNKYYEHVPHITNMLNGTKPPTMTLYIEEQLRNMFRDIQQPFERNKPKDRSNFLSYGYCLYKFCELLGYDEFLGCFPLLKSRDKLYQQDVIWKGICKDMHWEFIPTI